MEHIYPLPITDLIHCTYSAKLQVFVITSDNKVFDYQKYYLAISSADSTPQMFRIKYPGKNNIEFDTAEVSLPTTSHSHSDVSVLPIGKVRQLVETQMDVSLSSLELIYAGRKLNKPDKLLSDYGVKPNTIPVLHLLPKPKSRECGDVTGAAKDKLESAQSQEQLHKFISDFPTLHEALQDPAVVAQLKAFAANLSIHDFDLMLTLLPAGAPQIDPAQFRERLLRADTLPEYLKARPELAAFLNSLLVRDSSGRFRIDQQRLGEIPDLYSLGEDESEMDTDLNPGPALVIQPQSPVPSVPAQPIISEEMLSLALAQTAQGPAPRPGSANLSEKLGTLREMGFSNDTACLQALQASNGDIEAAVNLMLTSDIF